MPVSYLLLLLFNQNWKILPLISKALVGGFFFSNKFWRAILPSTIDVKFVGFDFQKKTKKIPTTTFWQSMRISFWYADGCVCRRISLEGEKKNHPNNAASTQQVTYTRHTDESLLDK